MKKNRLCSITASMLFSPPAYGERSAGKPTLPYKNAMKVGVLLLIWVRKIGKAKDKRPVSPPEAKF